MKQQDKQEIMMCCVFSAMFILGGIGVSYIMFQMMNWNGEISFIEALISFIFIPISIILARMVWLE